MRCLNEDEKEQYKGDKSIITANLIADEKPETFPFNGGPVSNLTENDILAPGSTLMILDGSGEIYMMKEENFCPNYGELNGYYELTIKRDNANGDIYVNHYNKENVLIDTIHVTAQGEGGNPDAPLTFHDLYFRMWYDGGSPYFPDSNMCAIYVDKDSGNVIRYDNVDYTSEQQIYILPYGKFFSDQPITLRFDIVSGQSENAWCKL